MTAVAALHPEAGAVGYPICEVVRRDETPVYRAKRHGILHHIAVDRDWRARGIGTRLLQEVVAQLSSEGIERLRADYFVFNEASAALMRNAGLQPLRITAEGAI